MAARTVSVLAPNGRRQTVHCTPNTTILQILEEVCKKQGFESEEFDIRHHNKVLDTSTTIRFSGLPNNAQLELSNAIKVRKESSILVALNLEDGSRVMGSFTPSNTLQDILASLYNDNKPNPVVIYTRREMYGSELETTNLRSLGLTSGRAMLRVIHRAPEDLKTQANVSSPIPVKPVEEQPYRRVFQPLEEDLTKCPASQDAPIERKSTNEATSNQQSTDKKSECTSKVDLVKLAKDLKKKEQKPLKQQLAAQKNDTEEAMEVDPVESTKKNTESKEKRRKTNIEEEFVFVGERNAMVFSLESAQAVQTEDLPEDFFELTIDDARQILKDIRQKREDAEEGGPLMTAAYRRLEESKKQLRQLSRYSKAVIRILFPDRTILQAVFSPADTIKIVSEFIAKYLENENMSFYLYSTPPKHILPEDKSLIEVDCVPGALLHFGIHTNGQPAATYLKHELKEKFTTNSMASLAAIKLREQYSRPQKDSQDTVAENEPEPVAGCSYQTYTDHPKRSSHNPEKVPKWFKHT